MTFVPMVRYTYAVTNVMQWYQQLLTATHMNNVGTIKIDSNANFCKIDVTQPHILQKYYECIGGVDDLD